jgi:hypothetical protein
MATFRAKFDTNHSRNTISIRKENWKQGVPFFGDAEIDFAHRSLVAEIMTFSLLIGGLDLHAKGLPKWMAVKDVDHLSAKEKSRIVSAAPRSLPRSTARSQHCADF